MKCPAEYFNQFLSSLLAGLAVLCVGCSVGWTTPVLKKLKEPDSPIHISAEESSWLAAAHEVGHFLSPIPAGLLLSCFGRKLCFVGSTSIIVVGWIIVIFSKTIWTLYLARFLFGISMGIVFTTVPLYIAEIASPRIRGALSTCFQAMLYLGHLIEFSIGPFVSFFWLNLISLIISVVSLFMLVFIVESPYHLISHGKREKAFSVVKWLLQNEDEEVENELFKIERTSEIGESLRANLSQLFSKHYSCKLLIVTFAAVAQRFTGMSAVVAYAASNFPSTEGGLTSDQYTILFGALVFIFTFLSASLIDNLGRRPLMLFSCLGCAVAHFVTGTYFYEGIKDFSYVPFIMISLFSIIYSLGLGPLVNTLQGELFPPNIKGVASAIVTLAHAASSFAVTKLFQVIRDKEGIYLNFYIFGASCTISFLISYFIVPETKREDLEALHRRESEERYT